MLVKGKIQNEQYIKLIQYSFEKTDAVMLVFRKDGFDDFEINKLNNTLEKVVNQFRNCLLKRRNGAYWVFSKVGYSQLGIVDYNDPLDFDKMFDIIFFKTEQEIKKYLLENKDLYAWLNPNYPEDIAFFKDGYCWLYSVAHEEMCDIYCENNEEYEYLKSIGIEFLDNKFISTSKDDLYYEEY